MNFVLRVFEKIRSFLQEDTDAVVCPYPIGPVVNQQQILAEAQTEYLERLRCQDVAISLARQELERQLIKAIFEQVEFERQRTAALIESRFKEWTTEWSQQLSEAKDLAVHSQTDNSDIRATLVSLQRETTARIATIQRTLSGMGAVQVRVQTPEEIKQEARKKIAEDAYVDDLYREPRNPTDHGLIPPGADLNRGRTTKTHDAGFPKLKPDQK